MRQNPHLEPHEAKAVAGTSGADEEHVEVTYKGKKYNHYVTNDQEPNVLYEEEAEQIDEMDKSQPSSSRGAEGLALGKKAHPVKPDKVKSDALKILQKQYKKQYKGVKEEVEQIDEANMRFDYKAAARPTSRDVENFQNRNTNRRAALQLKDTSVV